MRRLELSPICTADATTGSLSMMLLSSRPSDAMSSGSQESSGFRSGMFDSHLSWPMRSVVFVDSGHIGHGERGALFFRKAKTGNEWLAGGDASERCLRNTTHLSGSMKIRLLDPSDDPPTEAIASYNYRLGIC